MLSAFDLWILIPETRTLWVLIVENVRLTEVNFTCTCGSLWFSDSAVCRELAVTQPKWHRAITTASPSAPCIRMKPHMDAGPAVGSEEGVHEVGSGEESAKCCGAHHSVAPWHFIYQLAFFVNYKLLSFVVCFVVGLLLLLLGFWGFFGFFLHGRVKVSFIQRGTWVVGSRLV